MTIDNYLMNLADSLEVRLQEGESEQIFRARVAKAFLEEWGDCITATEIFLGKRYEQWGMEERALAMVLQIQYNQRKSEINDLTNETHYNMNWNKYLGILAGNKFEKVFSYDFRDSREESQEEYAVFVRRDLGMLLTAESWDNKSVINSTKLHYELSWLLNGKPFNELNRMSGFDILRGCSHGPCLSEDGEHVARNVSFDARKGLVGHIQKLRGSGLQTNVPWKFYKEHFLWLLDYTESREQDYDYKAITERKIRLLPKDVQIMIGANL